MTYVLWIIGVLSALLWLCAAWIVLSPPGDNSDARALGEILAVVPASLAAVATFLWCILAAIHWI